MGVDYGSRLWWHPFDGDELGRVLESVKVGGGVDGDFEKGTIGFWRMREWDKAATTLSIPSQKKGWLHYR